MASSTLMLTAIRKTPGNRALIGRDATTHRCIQIRSLLFTAALITAMQLNPGSLTAVVNLGGEARSLVASIIREEVYRAREQEDARGWQRRLVATAVGCALTCSGSSGAGCAGTRSVGRRPARRAGRVDGATKGAL